MIVITGAAGFIGSNLVKKYNKLGFKNLLLVDDLNKYHKKENIKKLKYKKIISKKEFIKKIEKNTFNEKIKTIFHLGANTNTINKDHKFLKKNNYTYSVKILDFAIKNNCKFLYASTMQVYGRSSKFLEKSIYEKPINFYSKSKLIFDNFARKMAIKNKNINILGLRFFNVFGYGEKHKKKMASSVYQFYEQNKNKGVITLFKNKNKKISRDFIFIDDCIDICVWLEKNYNKSSILNIGSGVSTSYVKIAKKIIQVMGYGKIEFIDIPRNIRNQYQYYSRANINLLKKHGYRNKITDLDTSVKKYIKFLIEKN